MKLNIVLLLSLSVSPLYACEGMVPENVMSQQSFETHKNQLPVSLQTFVNDFETWPKEDKTKISIMGLSFMTRGLDRARCTPYGDNIGFWVDCRTQTQQQRKSFIHCLKYLQERE